MADDSYLDNLRVVLVSTRNPLNIGAAARAMSNFGFRRLRVVNPYEVAFREAKSAVGAVELLKRAEEHDSVAAAVGDCNLVVGTTAARGRELQHSLRSLRQGAMLIRRELRRGRVGLLFGSEKRGLSNEDLSHCHWLLRIPTRPEQPSMNLGQAVAVCLYEIARLAPAKAKVESTKVASAGDLHRLAAELTQALEASGYTSGKKEVEQNIRRLVYRLNLSGEDAQLLLGMVRQMLWKMENRD